MQHMFIQIFKVLILDCRGAKDERLKETLPFLLFNKGNASICNTERRKLKRRR
jgi:hypothetical protein